MYFKLNLLLVNILMAINIVASNSVNALAQDSTQSLLLTSSDTDLQENTTSRYVQCFDYYNPLMKELYEEYEFSYTACLEASTIDREDMESIANSHVRALGLLINNLHEKLNGCKSLACYTELSLAGSNKLRNVGYAALNYEFKFEKGMNSLKTEEQQCIKELKDKINTKNAEAISDFGKCFSGVIEIPTRTTDNDDYDYSSEEFSENPEYGI